MKLIYTILCISFSFTISKPLFGQSVPETAFYWENPYYINPASINFDYMGYFTFSGRKQWLGIKGAPATYFATGAIYLEDYQMQSGVKILIDKIGYVSTLDLSLSYAYSMRLHWKGSLNLGIAGAYQAQTIDRDKVSIDNGNDPILTDKRLKGLKKWNSHLGIEYSYDRRLKVGLACQNLFSLKSRENNIWNNTNYFYARYRTRSLGRAFDAGRYRTRSIPRSYDTEAGICVRQTENDLQIDGMLSLYINRDTQEEKFQFSLFGRSIGEIGLLAGLKLISDIKFLCTYDYNFNALQGYSNGSFEIMVSIPIHRNKNAGCIYK